MSMNFRGPVIKEDLPVRPDHMAPPRIYIKWFNEIIKNGENVCSIESDIVIVIL